MRKRILVILLSVAVLFTFMPATAYAGTPNTWDSTHTYYYNGDGDPYTDWWAQIDGIWYYFQADGKVSKGWFTLGGEDRYYGNLSTGAILTGWQKIGGYWYYFEPLDGSINGDYYDQGRMYDYGVTKVNGKWYYFGTSDNASKWGKLQYGWVKDENGYWYYADAAKDGVLTTGWKKINGKWYYFEPTTTSDQYEFAEMYYSGPHTIKGSTYYFSNNGDMKTGWIKESGRYDDGEGNVYYYVNWFYADPSKDSRLATGWKKVDGKWYYFDKETYDMWSNCTATVSGKLYAFNRNGSLHEKTGWVDLYEEWYNSSGKKVKESWWVYTNSKGIATTGWKKISGVWYHFSEDGYMTANDWAKDSKGWMWMGSNGKAVKSRWVKDEGKWYYIKANSYMARNEWIKDGGSWYYLKGNGAMATGTVTIGGKTYHFASSGKWIP